MRTYLSTVGLLLLACGSTTDKNKDGVADGTQTPNDVSVVEPSTPIGTLSGQVLNIDLTPLDGVTVSVIMGGTGDADGTAYKATSDGTGAFAIGGLPAGSSGQVTLSKTGFATARTTAFVPASAGNFPIDNGNANLGVIALTDVSGEQKFQVLTGAGHPAKAAKATIEVTPAATFVTSTSTYGASAGIVTVDTASDDNGLIDFKAIPVLEQEMRLSGTFTVTIAALDEDGDGVYDFLGQRIQFSALDLYLGTANTQIVLPYARATGPVTIVASNVDSIMHGTGAPLINMVAPNTPLFFVFDQLVVESSIDLRITDELGTTPVTETHMLTGNILQVVPSLIEQGKEYNLALRITSSENGSMLASTGYYFGGDPKTPMPFGIAKVTYVKAPGHIMAELELGDSVNVTMNQPIKLVGGAAAPVTIDYDINNSGVKGDVPGEKGYPMGLSVYSLAANEPIAEPSSTFANLASGYTTRYQFFYGLPATVPVPVGQVFTCEFSKTPSTLSEYRTIWDQPIDAMDQTGTLASP